MKKFQKGFIVYDFEQFDFDMVKFLEDCKNKCEEMLVAVPTDEFFLRVMDEEPCLPYEGKKEILMHLKAVDEVIPFDINNMNKRDSLKKYHYDLCFYGSEYGSYFQKDKEYLVQQGVTLCSMLPESLERPMKNDIFKLVLKNAIASKKIVLFGTGAYFDHYIKYYGEEFPPVYALDNSPFKWDTEKMGVKIKNPHILCEENPEKVFIILCCKDYKSILQQIQNMGVFDYRPMKYNNELAIWDEQVVILREDKEYMEHAHSILMKLMKEFDRVCSKLGLRYYVIGGSLIGVIRHRGLIPWDDDIDVAMFRNDYEILRDHASEIWSKDSDYFFLDYDQFGENVFYDFFTRLVYMKEEIPTRLFKKIEGKTREDIQNKLVLDIFVLENADNSKIKHNIVTTVMKGLYALAMGHRAYIDYSEYSFFPKPILMVLKIVHQIGAMIPLRWLFALYEGLRGYARYKECKDVFESNNGAINYMPWRYDKNIYGEGKRMSMCGYDVLVPDDCDGLLKGKGYGNYMDLPSVNCRKPSHSAKSGGIIW